MNATDIARAELIEAARAARANAYAPYSRFAVGAAVRLTDGRILTASNLENASYGLSLCAETVAIASTASAGHLADITEIAIVGAIMDGADIADPLVMPCGRCRQVLAEAQSVAGRALVITCAQPQGAAWASFTLDELLPHAFGAPHLDPSKGEC